uniref:Uncharacterized protein n=1 Tax=Anser brachyrhynchus TaxID=132585 RepID=A0A8B9BFW6_9AVES
KVHHYLVLYSCPRHIHLKDYSALLKRLVPIASHVTVLLSSLELAYSSPLVLPESSQNIWLMVRFCRAAISEIMSLDLRRSSICTDCHRPKDTGQKKNHCACSTASCGGHAAFSLSPTNTSEGLYFCLLMKCSPVLTVAKSCTHFFSSLTASL